MAVKPHAGELLGSAARVDLGVEEVRHGRVVEYYAAGAGLLLDGQEFLNNQKIIGPGDAEAADFRVATMAKEVQLRPGSW